MINKLLIRTPDFWVLIPKRGHASAAASHSISRYGEQLIRKFAFILTDLQIKQIATECLYSHVQQAEA
jgi:hypothetical protein